MEQGRSFGTGELTPDVIRDARFSPRPDGAYSPAEVHEFLDQVASAMDVLGSTGVGQAMRRELQRNAEISSRVVMAGQETAERLRHQAADDARAIVEDAKHLAEQLRDASREEMRRTREHVEELRRVFIVELRDMYDRIGATLYRFDSASRVGETPDPGRGSGLPTPAGGQAPGAGGVQAEPPGGYAQQGYAPEQGHTREQAPDTGAAAPPPGPYGSTFPEEPWAVGSPAAPPSDAAWPGEPAPSSDAAVPVEPAPVDPAEAWGEQPPAADGQGWGGEGSAEGAPAEQAWLQPDHDPWGEQPVAEPSGWLVGEDPIAGSEDPEPLVDLRGIQHEIHPETAMQQPRVEAGPEAGMGADATDEDRAAALLGGADAPPGAGEEPPPLPAPPSLGSNEGGQEGDASAIQAFVMQALSEGQPRPAIEQYLGEAYGIPDASAFVDQVLAAGQPGGESPPAG